MGTYVRNDDVTVSFAYQLRFGSRFQLEFIFQTRLAKLSTLKPLQLLSSHANNVGASTPFGKLQPGRKGQNEAFATYDTVISHGHSIALILASYIT